MRNYKKRVMYFPLTFWTQCLWGVLIFCTCIRKKNLCPKRKKEIFHFFYWRMYAVTHNIQRFYYRLPFSDLLL